MHQSPGTCSSSTSWLSRLHSPQKAPVLISFSSHKQKADSNWANGALPRGRRRIKSEEGETAGFHKHLRTLEENAKQLYSGGPPHTPHSSWPGPYLTRCLVWLLSASLPPSPLSIPISQDSIFFFSKPPSPRTGPQPHRPGNRLLSIPRGPGLRNTVSEQHSQGTGISTSCWCMHLQREL